MAVAAVAGCFQLVLQRWPCSNQPCTKLVRRGAGSQTLVAVEPTLVPGEAVSASPDGVGVLCSFGRAQQAWGDTRTCRRHPLAASDHDAEATSFWYAIALSSLRDTSVTSEKSFAGFVQLIAPSPGGLHLARFSGRPDRPTIQSARVQIVTGGRLAR